jgi:hypothetical protein
MVVAGCAHLSLPNPEPQCLRESRVGRSIRRSLDGAPISFEAEQRLLASDPQSAQSEARSRRLMASSYVAFFVGFGVLASGIPLLATTSGPTQRGLTSLVATAPIGWALGLILSSYVDETHHDAIAWFNAAARGANHCPP